MMCFAFELSANAAVLVFVAVVCTSNRLHIVDLVVVQLDILLSSM